MLLMELQPANHWVLMEALYLENCGDSAAQQISIRYCEIQYDVAEINI
jgi:hypothetical protein